MARRLGASCVIALVSTAAQAGGVAVVQGEALVSHGEGYESVAGVTDLAAGDTVVAKAGNSVKVTFSNGCTVFLGMGMVFSVPTEPPCGGSGNVGSSAGANPEPSLSQTQDWSAVTQTMPEAGETQSNVTTYLLGAAAIGGVAAGALALSGGGGSPPASP